MGVIEEVKAALAEEVLRNIELRKELALEKERADALDVAYDMLRDDVVFTLEKQVRHYYALLHDARIKYAFHMGTCRGVTEAGPPCVCGYSEWLRAVSNLRKPELEELPFSEPPHD